MTTLKVNSWQSSSGSTLNNIVQIRNSQFTGAINTTGSTYVSTGHSVTITPKFATSKILLVWSGNISCENPNSGGLGAAGSHYTIFRDGTNIMTNTQSSMAFTYNEATSTTGVNNWHRQGFANILVDASSTASTTFTVYQRLSTGFTNVGSYAKYHGDWGSCSLTAMEIKQ
jgi:hypothetical protein